MADIARTRVYRNGVVEAEGFEIPRISDYFVDPSARVWADLCAPRAAELAAISEELGLHPPAAQDATYPSQRTSSSGTPPTCF